MSLDIELIEAFSDEALDLLLRWERICIDLKKSLDTDLMEELFRIAHNLKGGSRSVGLMEYGNFIHKVEDVITLLKNGKISYSELLQSKLLKCQKVLAEWTLSLKRGNFESPNTAVLLSDLESTISSNSENSIEMLVDSEIKNLENESQIIDKLKQNDHKTKTEIASGKKKKSDSSKNSSNSNNETIRISASKLDQILQTIGELSIQQNILWHSRSEASNSNQVFNKSLQLGQKLIKDLYDKALGLRMQPLESLFQRLERNILELSQTLNKPINLNIVGADVELDKTVIEKIVDPLTHIVRNAIDHGIEKAEERSLKNKPANGTVEIQARQETFGILITISDDGKGLDPEKLRNKAIEKGLIKPQQELSNKEIFQFIFHPGFSTAEKVTEVSGRGVGMDVVRKVVDSISGKIEIESHLNLGTKFSIVLPTSVNIIEGMLVLIHNHTYVIPISSIDEVIDINKGETARIHHSAILPIVDLRNLLQVDKKFKSETNYETIPAVISEYRGIKIAFLVEKIIGQQQVVIRPLNENINGSLGIMGGTILGSGEPGLIIDLPLLTDHYLNSTYIKESV